MCLFPRQILNQSKSLYGGNMYINIPCRNCRECQDISQQDYTSRAIGEYLYYMSLGKPFSVHFCTFTFNPESLPKHQLFYRHDDIWLPGEYVDTFDHDILKTFKNSLRKYYNRLHLPSPTYLFSSQYGEEKQRPHYHAIIFLPQDISYKSAQLLFLRFWKYGFIKNIKLQQYFQSQERSLLNCIKYVTRYTTRYSLNAPSWVFDKSKSLDIAPYRFRPRIFTSNGFGSYLYKLFTPSAIAAGKMSLFFDNKYISISFGQYFRRRFLTRTFYTHETTFKFDDSPHLPMYDEKLLNLVNNPSKIHDPFVHKLQKYYNKQGNIRYIHKVIKSTSKSYRTPFYLSVQWDIQESIYKDMLINFPLHVNQGHIDESLFQGFYNYSYLKSNFAKLLEDAKSIYNVKRLYEPFYHYKTDSDGVPPTRELPKKTQLRDDSYLHKFYLYYSAQLRKFRIHQKRLLELNEQQYYLTHPKLRPERSEDAPFAAEGGARQKM